MKAGIHPQYYPEAQVVCVCGNSFSIGSTKPQLTVEICAKCHPFFTGQMKYVDILGRVERFQAQQAAVAGKKVVSKKLLKILKKKQAEAEEAARPKSLKEMLQRVKQANG